MKQFAFYFCILLIACGNGKSSDKNQLASNSKNESSQETNSSVADNSGDGDIVGEWKLTMWIGDKNINNKIDDDERADAIKEVNDYMKLSSDGSAVFTPYNWEGRYEIKPNSNGTSKYLNLFDKNGNKYAKGEIISVTKTELILLSHSVGAIFRVWKRL